MKKLVLKLIGLVVVLVIVAIVVIYFSLNSLVKKGVETIGPQLTKVEIKLNRVSLSPLSGRGELGGLFIGNPEGFKTPSAVQLDIVRLGLEPSSVLSDVIVVNEVLVKGPEITLEGTLGGDNNLSKILDNLKASAGASETPAKPGTEPPAKKEKKFYVKDVLIEGGKVHLSMTLFQGQAATVPLPAVHLQNIGTPEEGVTSAELSKQIMVALLENVTKAAAEGVANLGKDVENIRKSVDEASKAVQGLKGLLK